jgi:hypothetical protein
MRQDEEGRILTAENTEGAQSSQRKIKIEFSLRTPCFHSAYSVVYLNIYAGFMRRGCG